MNTSLAFSFNTKATPLPLPQRTRFTFQYMRNKHHIIVRIWQVDTKANLKSLLIVDSALRISAVKNQVTIDALSVNGQALLPALKNRTKRKAF